MMIALHSTLNLIAQDGPSNNRIQTWIHLLLKVNCTPSALLSYFILRTLGFFKQLWAKPILFLPICPIIYWYSYCSTLPQKVMALASVFTQCPLQLRSLMSTWKRVDDTIHSCYNKKGYTTKYMSLEFHCVSTTYIGNTLCQPFVQTVFHLWYQTSAGLQ